LEPLPYSLALGISVSVTLAVFASLIPPVSHASPPPSRVLVAASQPEPFPTSTPTTVPTPFPTFALPTRAPTSTRTPQPTAVPGLVFQVPTPWPTVDLSNSSPVAVRGVRGTPEVPTSALDRRAESVGDTGQD
jgi:hypothetical protein